jgi:hypothetical protein
MKRVMQRDGAATKHGLGHKKAQKAQRIAGNLHRKTRFRGIVVQSNAGNPPHIAPDFTGKGLKAGTIQFSTSEAVSPLSLSVSQSNPIAIPIAIPREPPPRLGENGIVQVG